MRNEKRYVYSGNTFVVKNIIPDITEDERKFIKQGIAEELEKVFRRGR